MNLPTVPLAFGFLGAPMLWGLAGASAPIIIHLLNRRRFKQMEWAAMHWLLAAIRKNARRLRLEQLLLLALRTALIVALVLAMAKPYVQHAGLLPLGGGKRTHKVIVLDASFSMDYRLAGASRFDRGRGFAEQIVKTARQGDQVSIILMADPPRVLGEPSPSLSTVLAELGTLKVSHSGADVAQALDKARAVLDHSPLHRKELWVITDLQRNSWTGAAGSGDPVTLRAVCQKLNRLAPTTLVDVGQTSFENLAVTGLESRSPFVALNQAAGIQATLHNFGRSPARAVPVRLRIDGEVEAQETVDLAPGSTVAVDFSPTLATAGDHLIEVAIPQDIDPLAIDNHRYLVLPVRDHLQVLLVDGKPSGEPFQAATDYLRFALSPQSEAESSSFIQQDVVAPSAISDRELSPYDCLVLCNVDRFTEGDVRLLDNYLRQGGGLIVFLGDQVDIANYNRLLFADGKGLLPARLESVQGSADRNGAGLTFDPLRYAHPILANFRGQESNVLAGLTSAVTYAYIKAAVPDHSPARTVMSFSGTPDPAIVEKPAYRGHVVLVTTTASTAWTAWPVKPSYPAVVNDMLRFAIAGRLAQKTTMVGRPLIETKPAIAEEVPVTVVTPDHHEEPQRLSPGGEISQFRFESTELSGPYRVRFGPPLASTELFAVNVDPRESDLTKLEANELRQAVPGWNVSVMTPDRSTAGARPESSLRRGELYRYLLYTVLGMLLVESVLAWKFGHYTTP